MLPDVLVRNAGPYALNLGSGKHSLFLNVGATLVNRKLLTEILREKPSRRMFDAQCTLESGQVEGTEDVAPARATAQTQIQKLTIKAAKDLIAKCSDFQVLEAWLSLDGRAAVHLALQTRYQELAQAEKVSGGAGGRVEYIEAK